MRNSQEFEKLIKTLKEIRDEKKIEKLFEEYLPKKMSRFKSLVSEKYGYDIAKQLKDDMEKIFYEFYEDK